MNARRMLSWGTGIGLLLGIVALFWFTAISATAQAGATPAATRTPRATATAAVAATETLTATEEMTGTEAVTATAATTLTGDALSAQQIDAALTELTKKNVFGGSVLIARDGVPILNKGYGPANVEWDIPNSPKTKFRIAHLTASFTAAAVLKLVEQGLLDLEDPVCDYVDPCPEGWATMTIHHLMNHKSGLPHFRPMSEPGNWMHATISPWQFVERVRDAPLLFEPGEEREYSHTNWAVLGYIIERVTGGTFEAYLRENILEPLDMADTGMDKKSLVLPQRAYGYAGGRVAEYTDPSQLYSALGMYSTTEDLLKWDQALYTDTLLPQKSLDLLFTPGPEPIFRGSNIPYGIGWWMDPTGGRPSINSGGGVSGYNYALVRYPDEKLTIIILSNREDGDAWSLIDGMLAPMIFDNE